MLESVDRVGRAVPTDRLGDDGGAGGRNRQPQPARRPSRRGHRRGHLLLVRDIGLDVGGILIELVDEGLARFQAAARDGDVGSHPAESTGGLGTEP